MKTIIDWCKKELNPFVDHDRMAEIIGVERIGDWDMRIDWQFDYDPDNPEEHDAERDEAWIRYSNALESCCKKLLELHHLDLSPTKKPWLFKIVPKESWEKSAAEVMQTINGHGLFYFASLRIFLDSGPYTPRAAVLTHLHWLKKWPEVYEGTKASRMFDRMYR